MAEHGFVPHIVFGLNPLAVSTLILVLTYAVIIWDRFNRAVVALLGAAILILVGALDLVAAV
jgi:Na+/H+ antiporter NhaD/arsenite permease-like protein